MALWWGELWPSGHQRWSEGVLWEVAGICQLQPGLRVAIGSQSRVLMEAKMGTHVRETKNWGLSVTSGGCWASRYLSFTSLCFLPLFPHLLKSPWQALGILLFKVDYGILPTLKTFIDSRGTKCDQSLEVHVQSLVICMRDASAEGR